MFQVHHLHRSSVLTFDLRGETLTEDRQLFAIRGANMSWKVSGRSAFSAERSKQKQVGKLACCKPGEPAAVSNSPEGQASVTIETVPAKVGNLELFPAHRFHGIPKECFNVSDFYRHVRYAGT
jgi:hypothetical protein